MSTRDPSRRAAASKGKKSLKSNSYRVEWCSDEDLVWLTMRYYNGRELKRLFRDFQWISLHLSTRGMTLAIHRRLIRNRIAMSFGK